MSQSKSLLLPPEIWERFGDAESASRLACTSDIQQFENIARQFHARLALLVRGLHFNELQVIFKQCLPTFYDKADKATRNKVERVFEDAHLYIEGQLILRINAYAKKWLETAAGADYLKKWQFSV